MMLESMFEHMFEKGLNGFKAEGVEDITIGNVL